MVPAPLPERTLFYGVKPIGVGSLEVESTKSYFQRLALKHSQTPGKLFRLMLREYPLVDVPPSNRLCVEKVPWHRYSPLFRQIRERIQRSTGVELVETTFERLNHLFSDLCSTHIQSAKYCPLCVQQTESVQHGRLLWEIDHVAVCPIHRVNLCFDDYCESDLANSVPKHRRIEHPCICSTCGCIGYRCRHEKPEVANAVQLSVAVGMGRLLAMNEVTIRTIFMQPIKNGVNRAISEYYGGSI